MEQDGGLQCVTLGNAHVLLLAVFKHFVYCNIKTLTLGELHLYQKRANNVKLTHQEQSTALSVATTVRRAPVLC